LHFLDGDFSFEEKKMNLKLFLDIPYKRNGTRAWVLGDTYDMSSNLAIGDSWRTWGFRQNSGKINPGRQVQASAG